MKTILNYLFILSVVFAVSCSKGLEVPEPVFEVETNKQTYKLGDTVFFNIKGNAEFVTFYSGEPGNEYQYKDRTVFEGKARQILTFTSYRQWCCQENTMEFYYSTDFDGKIDSNLASQNWVNITSRVNWSTGTDNTPSGEIDLTNSVDGKPFYLA